MERVLSAIEIVAAFAIGVVAALVFVTVVLRYGFSMNLPDGFDFARYLQGIAILWGLGVATYRGGHISIDLVWELSGPGPKRAIGIFAAASTAAFFCLFAWVLFQRLPSFAASRELTADLRLPVWPFYLMAISGVLATAFVSVVVLLRSFKAGEACDG